MEEQDDNPFLKSLKSFKGAPAKTQTSGAVSISPFDDLELPAPQKKKSYLQRLLDPLRKAWQEVRQMYSLN